MDRSTINRIFIWGMIFAKLRDRSEPLTELEIMLLEATKDPHYRRTIALLKLLQHKPLTLKEIARRMKTSDRNANDFIGALGRGGFGFIYSHGRFVFECESDRALMRILEWGDR